MYAGFHSLSLLSATFAWGEEREEGGRGERSGQPHYTLGEERGRGEKGPKIYTHATTCLFPTFFFSRFFAGHECTHTLGFSTPKVSLRKVGGNSRHEEGKSSCVVRLEFASGHDPRESTR